MTEGRPDREPEAGGLMGTAVRQTGWSSLATIARQTVRFLVLLGLARLLLPSHFGVVAEAVVFTSLLGTVAALGLEPSLVQADDIETADFTTAAWASAGLALGVLVAALLLAPLAARLFGEESLRAVLPAMAVVTALRNLGLAPRARLRRDLDYRSLALASLSGTVLGGLAALGLALLEFGVWSLVAQGLVSAGVTVTWLWPASGLRPRLRFSRGRLSRLVQFGGPYTGEQLLNFVNRKADDLIIGVFLGDTALGFYRVAYMALQALTRVLSKSVNAVALPVFARAAAETDRLRSQFLRATETTALIALPACAGFALVADLAITVLYGPGWGPAVPAARVLSFVALAHSLLLFSPTAMYARGRSDLQLRLTALYAVLNVVGFLVGVRWGIVGVAAAYAIQNLVTAPVELGVLDRMIELPYRRYLATLWRPAVAGIALAAAVLGLRSVLTVGPPEELVASVLVGVAVYTVALLATGRSHITRLVRPVLSELRSGADP